MNVAYFRALRHHIWGKNKLEVAMEGSGSVQIWPPSKESMAFLEGVFTVKDK